MTFTTRRLLAALIAILLAVGACGGDDAGPAEPDLAEDADRVTETSEPTTTTTTEPESSTEAVETYFDAIASTRLSDLNRALEVAEPGSPAELYLRYFIAAGGLNLFAGAQDITYLDDGSIETCPLDFPDEPCAVFSDVRSNEAGRVVTFVTGGHELGERITALGDPLVQRGVTLTPIVAYQSQGDALFVMFDVTNGMNGALIPANYEAVYIDGAGRQSSAISGYGLTAEVQPGATAGDAVAFEAATRPGTVKYHLFTDDFSTEIAFDIPIP